MIKPRQRTWDVGRDAYGRPVILRHDTGDKGGWEIVSQAVDQRDEGEHTRSLTLANLQAIAEIVAQEKG